MVAVTRHLYHVPEQRLNHVRADGTSARRGTGQAIPIAGSDIKFSTIILIVSGSGLGWTSKVFAHRKPILSDSGLSSLNVV
jgi:hypothetical protein